MSTIFNENNLHYVHVYAFYNAQKQAEIMHNLDALTFNSDEESMVKIMGKYIKIPRLQTAFGDVGISYKFSGNSVPAKPWPDFLIDIKADMMGYLKYRLNIDLQDAEINYVLVNKYRDRNDYIGYHSDDEKDLVAINGETIIASLSFGSSREFSLQHKKTKETEALRLCSGDLVVMRGNTQKYWKHSILKERNAVVVRYNLTFRFMKLMDLTIKDIKFDIDSSNILHFYGQYGEYGYLSNFYKDNNFTLLLPDDLSSYLMDPELLIIDADFVNYPTSEHAYQIRKMINKDMENISIQKYHEYKKIMLAAESGSEVAALGRQKVGKNAKINAVIREYQAYVKCLDNWDHIKDQVMYFIVYQKFKQNPAILKKLLATDDRQLTEHTANDHYWADGGDGSGKNMLGKTLMLVKMHLSSRKNVFL